MMDCNKSLIFLVKKSIIEKLIKSYLKKNDIRYPFRPIQFCVYDLEQFELFHRIVKCFKR